MREVFQLFLFHKVCNYGKNSKIIYSNGRLSIFVTDISNKIIENGFTMWHCWFTKCR